MPSPEMPVRPQQPIQPFFSLAFQLRYCVGLLALSAAGAIVFFQFFDNRLDEGYLASLLTLHELQLLLPVVLTVLAGLQILIIFLLSLAILVFVSHRIAGPVFRYEQALQGIVAGDLRQKVRTRRTDQLKPLVTALNDFQAAMRGRFGQLRRLQAEVDAALAAAERGTWTEAERERLGRLAAECSLPPQEEDRP